MYSITEFLVPARNRHLIQQFSRRELTGRYRGSVLGFTWAALNPLFMLGIYSFAFAYVFKARWPGLEEIGGIGYTLNLFCGLIIFNLFSDVITRAPNQIHEHANLVKKVVFPLHTLAWSTLLAALVQFVISLIILLLAIALLSPAGLSASALSLPLIILAFVPFLLGASWFLSSVGTFIRDIVQFIQVFVTLTLFVSPIFYPSTLLPEALRPVIAMNPLSLIVEQARAVLITGTWPDITSLIFYSLFSFLVAIAGAWWFRRTHSAFADVI